MSRTNDNRGNGSIRRNSPVNSPEPFSKFSEEFLKERLRNREMIQNKMKNLNTKLYSSQSDLIKQYEPSQNPQFPVQTKPPRSRQRKAIQEQHRSQPVTSSQAMRMVKQLRQSYENEIAILTRANQMKIKALEQVVVGKEKIIKELEIENGILKGQLERVESCFQTRGKWGV